MEFLPPHIEEYAERFTANEPALLQELHRFTHQNVLQPRMLAGALQGRFISMLSKMIKPKRILEIGTYTGYSALCWAEGLASDGLIDTIEINDELESKIMSFVSRSEFASNIKLHIGDALQVIQGLTDKYDIVYIDADKANYSNYFDATIDQVKSGGYIIADNVLWSGKVTANPANMDHDTRCLFNYAKKIQEDERVEEFLLPLRDGLLIARKII